MMRLERGLAYWPDGYGRGDDHVPGVRGDCARDHADERVRVLLRLQGLRRHAPPAARRLLRVLLLLGARVPAEAVLLVDDDDPVAVARHVRTGAEGDAAEGDRYVELSGARLPACARVRPERARVADAGVDHEPGPPVCEGKAGDVAADERAAQRATAVNHQHAPVAGLADPLPHEHVVLVAAHGRDLARERVLATELAKHGVARGSTIAVLVEEIGGRDHRPSIRAA